MSRPRQAVGRARRERRVVWILVIAIAVIAIASLRMFLDRPPGGSLQLAWPEERWIGLRATAIAVAAIVGVALGLSGLLLQTLLRNPLASPYILGLSSGAGLGVTVAAYLTTIGVLPALNEAGDAIPALIGAGAVLLIVYALGQRRGWIDPISLVLVGVVVSAICAALIMFIQHLSPAGVIQDIIRWMFGRIPQAVSSSALIATGAIVIAACAISLLLARAFDASMLGDDEARSIGANVAALRLVMFVLAGVLTAASVALAGPIGFVGIIAPHAARILVGPRHGALIPATALCGAGILLAADAASTAIFLESGRLPVGILTALVGGPVFIWLLRSKGGRWM